MKIMTKTMTATAIAAAMQTSSISVEAVIAALAELGETKKKPALKPISKQDQVARARPGVHPVRNVVGLYLRKGEGESGAWFRRYWSNGKRREMGFGAISGPHKVTLEQARDKAIDFDNERRQGNDPLELKRAAARAKAQAALPAARQEQWNFKTATEEYLKSHGKAWKHARSQEIWYSPLARYAYPLIGEMPLDDIGVGEIDKIMTAAVEGGAPKVAPRIRLRIEQILNAAIVKGKRKPGNPALIGLIRAIRPMPKRKGEHFRRIEIAEAPAAFQRLKELAADSTQLSAFCFMILTAARPSEALNATWGEIDLDKRVWTVPKERMKGGKPHVVPLSSLAITILERQKGVRVSDAIFPGRSKGPVSYANFVWSAGKERIGLDAGSAHSWRSIFRDWAGDIGRVDRDLAEAALAHALPNVEGSYRRGSAIEARRPEMEKYAAWLMKPPAKVVTLEKRRA
jgi:integrase